MRLQRSYIGLIYFLLLLMGFSQETFSNSLYSKYGIGILRPYAGASYFGQGNIGIAAYSPIALQYLNPAALAYLTRTRFEGSFLFERANVKLNNNTGKFSDSGFNTLHIGIPMADGYALGFGLMPYSIIAHTYEDVVDGEYRSELEGTGGLERAFFRLSGMIGKKFAYGAGFDVYFGRLERTWRVYFDNATYNKTEDVTSTTAVGMSGHVGFLIELHQKLHIAGMINAPASLNTKTQTDYVFRTENDITEGEIKLPLTQGYGLNFKPNSRFTLLADFEASNWGSLAASEILGAKTTDTKRYGVGIEFVPSRKFNESVWKKMSYRLGFNMGNLPYLVAGEKVNEKFVNAGLTLPYNAFNSQMEIGLEYGKRGDANQIGSEENIIRFIFGIASGEKWFVRPERRRKD